ncbi:bifunctional UDP-N-acetylmuramoyl-tripeptide:D-alanyl-D-alanine ligase/alanine racemase [Parapedobacter sp. 2B3]|uniref:bifunctional UDP-N-acetylmuramoyl-tripeptide:D-alanyl-D-alanine ligase/alanine racemase n=1 Tax=Parapedobacter sp. 2B3 TaxID=3342381 RepID=UPI0035B5D968
MAVHTQSYTIRQVSDMMQTVGVSLVDETATVTTLLYDSRRLADVAQGLFFALVDRRDGHRYIGDAYDAGVRNFVVMDGWADRELFAEANFIVVADTIRALQELAASHRARFAYPVIGITGSNGKTIVKEWLMQLLAPDYRIARSPKSYNSQIGVALSLWQMGAGHELAIIEAGVSRLGEMEALHRMIQPDIAVLTTIGPAHDDGFASRQEKVREKLQLFHGARLAVYSPDAIADVPVPSDGTHVTWGRHGATLMVLGFEAADDAQCTIRAHYQGEDVAINIPFTDAAARANALCCWAVLLAMGYRQTVIRERMALLQPVEMRLEMKKGINHCTVIDDSYSNDLASLSIALDFLKQQHRHPMRTLILSDLPGESEHKGDVYKNLFKLLEDSGINRLITVGPALQKLAGTYNGMPHESFANTDTLLAALPTLEFQHETILLKGARRFAFERISTALTAKVHDTVLAINLSAVEHNLNQYRSLLPKKVKLMAMVKAFSYGSGDFEIASLLQFNRVDYLAVAYADEGVELRKAGIWMPIMVMNPRPASFGALLEHQLEPEIYSFDILEELLGMLVSRGITDHPIHIKVDTGMHRLGFSEGDAAPLAQLLQNAAGVKVKSVFSHLAAAGDAKHDAFTAGQLAAFHVFADELTAALGYPVLRHIANTAGIQRWPQAHLDMVRLGIGLYGVGDLGGNRLQLQQTGSLKTVITQLRQVPAGDSVGYGRRGRVTESSLIATVNIGYADGYDRRFGNGVGYMVVNGAKAPTVGDICMDMTMLDLTGIHAQVGDEVVVFDDMEEQAAAIGTIPYELLTGISQRVKRIYYYEM